MSAASPASEAPAPTETSRLTSPWQIFGFTLGALAGASGLLLDALDVMSLGLTPSLGIFAVGGFMGLRMVKNTTDHYDAIANLPWLDPILALGRAVIGDKNKSRTENLMTFVHATPTIAISALLGLGAGMGTYAALSTTALLAIPTPVSVAAALLIGLGNYSLGHLSFIGSKDLNGKDIGVVAAAKQYFHQLRTEAGQLNLKRVLAHTLVTALSVGFFLPSLISAGPLGILIGTASLISIGAVLNRVDLVQDLTNFFSTLTFSKSGHQNALDLAWKEAHPVMKFIGTAASIANGIGGAIFTTQGLAAGGALAATGIPPLGLGLFIGAGLGFLFYGTVKQMHLLTYSDKDKQKFADQAEDSNTAEELASLNANKQSELTKAAQAAMINLANAGDCKTDKRWTFDAPEAGSNGQRPYVLNEEQSPGVFAAAEQITEYRHRSRINGAVDQTMKCLATKTAAKAKLD